MYHLDVFIIKLFYGMKLAVPDFASLEKANT